MLGIRAEERSHRMSQCSGWRDVAHADLDPYSAVGDTPERNSTRSLDRGPFHTFPGDGLVGHPLGDDGIPFDWHSCRTRSHPMGPVLIGAANLTQVAHESGEVLEIAPGLPYLLQWRIHLDRLLNLDSCCRTAAAQDCGQ